MAVLTWDQIGDHIYETGVKKGVLYPYDTENKKYSPGVAWNGISSFNESPSGADESAIYADDIKYLSLRSAEDLGATIEAYTYPDEWALCDGSATLIKGAVIGQQARKMFGLCFRTTVGNDTEGNDHAISCISFTDALLHLQRDHTQQLMIHLRQTLSHGRFQQLQ